MNENNDWINELPELDFENVNDDPILGPLLEASRKEDMRDKALVLMPDTMLKVRYIITLLKKILDTNKTTEEYTIEINPLEKYGVSYGKEIDIVVLTDSMGTSYLDHPIFKTIINTVDSYDSEIYSEDKIRYYFGIKDAFIEIKPNNDPS